MKQIPPFRRFAAFVLKLLVLPLLLAGCATPTPYQRIGNKKEGGYSSARHSNDTYSVTYQGAEGSKPELVYDFALLRSAELTVECGYKYFLVTSDHDASRTAIQYTPGSPALRTMDTRTTSTGRTYYSSTMIAPATPSSRVQVKVPSYVLMIKMYNDKDAVRAPTSQVFEAAPLIGQLKTKHKLP